MYQKNELISAIKQIITMHHYFILADIEEKLVEYSIEEIDAKRFITDLTAVTYCSRDSLSDYAILCVNKVLYKD